MATSWGQRKSLGRRYTSDPALTYELLRLQNVYNLAPTRSAQSLQKQQIENQASQFGRSLAQNESQYARSLALQQEKLNAESEQWAKSFEAQQSQFEASLAQSRSQFAENMTLAKQNYDLAAQKAKDDKELAAAQLKFQQDQAAAQLKFQQDQAAANQRLQEDQLAAQEQAGLYSTIGNLAMTGGMLYAMKGGGSGKGLGLFGGKEAAQNPYTLARIDPAQLSDIAPASIDTAAGAGGMGQGIAPSVAPATMPVTPAATPLTTTTGTGMTTPVGGATDFTSIMNSADTSLAAQQAAAASGGGIESGLGFGGMIGESAGYGGGIEAGYGFGGQIGGETAATLGSGLGTAIGAAGVAAPYVAAATIGMPILGNVLESAWKGLGVEPGSSNVFAQANTITGQSYMRPIEAATETVFNTDVPDWAEAIFNPGGYLLNMFCFAAGTPITMADGTEKPAEDVKVGDEMMNGGICTGIGQHLSGDLYDYLGVQVTGSHAVRENGEWIRVGESPFAEPITLEAPVMVYIIDNEKHVIRINGMDFADFTEIDGSEYMMPDKRIEAMNRRDGGQV